MSQDKLNALCKQYKVPEGWAFDARLQPDTCAVMFRLHDGRMVIPYLAGFDAIEPDPERAVRVAYKELKAAATGAMERLQFAVAGMS